MCILLASTARQLTSTVETKLEVSLRYLVVSGPLSNSSWYTNAGEDSRRRPAAATDGILRKSIVLPTSSCGNEPKTNVLRYVKLTGHRERYCSGYSLRLRLFSCSCSASFVSTSPGRLVMNSASLEGSACSTSTGTRNDRHTIIFLGETSRTR